MARAIPLILKPAVAGAGLMLGSGLAWKIGLLGAGLASVALVGLPADAHKDAAETPAVTAAASTRVAEPAADCSPASIAHYAWRATFVFERDRKGLLYGVETHTPVTRVGSTPGVLSCALVVHAILKRAGCGWAKYSPDAKAVYDMALGKGWQRRETQEPGCIVACNSRQEGRRPAIDRSEGPRTVQFRHVGITTGRWLAVDNTSALSRPLPFFTWRPYRYQSPTFICPPKETAALQSQPG
jgi:hypothetical protein